MDRWPEIESLYHRAQAWPRSERAARLADACAGDQELQREVEELLEESDRSGQMLDRPAWSATASAVREESGVQVGMTLGAYEIEAPLGAGGMGEVWKARDRRLHRTVAIKISQAQFSDRVEREARAVAALNHPNIGALYDVGVAPSGLTYLVLEYVDGSTLADRIAHGPLPLADALPIARQIADALEAAHERGIVHRDLKPANIKLRPDGTIKVLDFGLAKALDVSGEAIAAADISAVGTITGTAAYMAPEQARGEAVDKRADIWAFGVVLYEMLAVRRPFKGDSVPDVLASVLKEEPNFSDVPPQVHRLLRSCLEKDPRKRLRDIGDAMRFFVDDDRATSKAPRVSRGLGRGVVAAAVAAVLAASLLLYGFRYTGGKPVVAARSVSFQVIPPGISRYVALALSPDGRSLAFSATGFDGITRLWVRDFDSLAARSIPEAEGIAGAPIWSPDGGFIAFASGGKLKKIDASGGTPVTLCDWPGEGGVLTGVWGADDEILFSRATGGLQRVPGSGGACADVTASGRRPTLLPDGRHFLYVRSEGEATPAGVYLGSLDTTPAEQPSQLILATHFASGNAFVQTSDPTRGYLLFNEPVGSAAVQGTLVTQPFDLRELKLTGETAAVPVLAAGGFGSGSSAMLFSLSSSGTIAYSTNGTGRYQNVWYDRTGKIIGTAGDAGDIGDVALSPDDQRAAYHDRAGSDDLWIFDFARRVSTRLTTSANRDHQAVWSPDGTRIIWGLQTEQTQALFEKASNGTGEERLLVKGGGDTFNIPDDWSPDGRVFLYAEGALKSGPAFNVGLGRTLWALPLRPDATPAGPPTAYLDNARGIGHAQFSPNGRYVAYTIGTEDAQNVYVSPFPLPSGREERWAISSGGGYQPLWRSDGKEMLFVAPDNRIMSVDVDTTSALFQSGAPKPLFAVRIAGGPSSAPTHRWDTSRDGQRFLVTTVLDVTQSPPINVVTDWESQLGR